MADRKLSTVGSSINGCESSHRLAECRANSGWAVKLGKDNIWLSANRQNRTINHHKVLTHNRLWKMVIAKKTAKKLSKAVIRGADEWATARSTNPMPAVRRSPLLKSGGD
ncbi:hypothetical protein NA78x_005660 [Anatilimnocola sp. NA78]|uniref:hypothetical protein n=1 Tax=Anatilimnocola sp. NA78 TaxID=3415683 RepID=UPI003CE48F32